MRALCFFRLRCCLDSAEYTLILRHMRVMVERVCCCRCYAVARETIRVITARRQVSRHAATRRAGCLLPPAPAYAIAASLMRADVSPCHDAILIYAITRDAAAPRVIAR